MKTIILAGGFGTRLSEKTSDIPKPMVKIGFRPILWHLMKYYASYGHKDFILCLGYKADVIKDPAVVVPRSTSIYERYLGKDGVLQAEPASWIVDPENRVIRLRPERVYTWGE